MRYQKDDFLKLDGSVGPLVERDGKRGIYGLFAEYRCLSNFHLGTVAVEGIEYPSSEAAYMAQKTDILEEKLECARQVSPSAVKNYGQTVTLKKDWDDIKYDAMKKVLIAKFTQAPELAHILLNTGNLYIEETNWWNDNYWGVCDTKLGQNNLGKILMEVREAIRNREVATNFVGMKALGE